MQLILTLVCALDSCCGRLQSALKAAGAESITVAEAQGMIDAVDVDGNGKIELNELANVLTKGTLFDGVVKP